MAAIDPNAKYGNTSPIKNCAEHHGVSYEMALMIADYFTHGRLRGYFAVVAYEAYYQMSGEARLALRDDLLEIAGRVLH